MTCDSCGRELQIGEWAWCPHGRVDGRPAASGFPLTTKHIDGVERTFNSDRELQAFCKANGVTHRPDAGWLTKEIVGMDRKSGKPVYKEGSGVGLPGCWV